MQVTIEFLCPECGCLTPAFADIPDDLHPRQPLDFTNDCFHCDEPLTQRRRAGEFAPPTKGEQKEAP